MRLTAFVFLIFYLASITSSYGQDHCVSKNHTLQVEYFVIERQARPYQIEHNGRDHSGVITEVVYKLFEKTDYQLRTWTYPFRRMIYLMKQNRCPTNVIKRDCSNWVNYGAYSWNNEQSINLTYMPVFNVQNVLVSYKLPDFKYNTLYSLQGKTLVLLTGFDYPGLISYAKDGNMDIVYTNSFHSAYGILKRLDGRGLFSDFKLRAIYNLKTAGLINNPDYRIHDIGKLLPNYGIHIAMSPKIDAKLKGFINSCLRQLHDIGFVESVLQKYSKTND